jgi:hypothetical protein
MDLNPKPANINFFHTCVAELQSDAAAALIFLIMAIHYAKKIWPPC